MKKRLLKKMYVENRIKLINERLEYVKFLSYTPNHEELEDMVETYKSGLFGTGYEAKNIKQACKEGLMVIESLHEQFIRIDHDTRKEATFKRVLRNLETVKRITGINLNK